MHFVKAYYGINFPLLCTLLYEVHNYVFSGENAVLIPCNSTIAWSQAQDVKGGGQG